MDHIVYVLGVTTVVAAVLAGCVTWLERRAARTAAAERRKLSTRPPAAASRPPVPYHRDRAA